MDKLDKMLDAYIEHFEENFPMMLCRHMEEDEIIKLIQKCIDNDEQYEPKLDIEANY